MKFSKLIKENINFFGEGNKISEILRNLEIELEKCSFYAKKIKKFAHKFDFDDKIIGNGYHSFVDIYDSAVNQIYGNLTKLSKSRKSFFFNIKKFEV